jgi:hypothetical protein
MPTISADSKYLVTISGLNVPLSTTRCNSILVNNTVLTAEQSLKLLEEIDASKYIERGLRIKFADFETKRPSIPQPSINYLRRVLNVNGVVADEISESKSANESEARKTSPVVESQNDVVATVKEQPRVENARSENKKNRKNQNPVEDTVAPQNVVETQTIDNSPTIADADVDKRAELLNSGVFTSEELDSYSDSEISELYTDYTKDKS